MNRVIFQILLTVVLMFVHQNYCFAQVNFLGKPGLVRIPKATVNETRDNISFQFSRMPYAYGINNFMNQRAEEFFYSAQIQPLRWVSVNFVLTRPVDVPRIGIGDRHLDLQFFVLNQEKYGVNVSLIFSPMMGSSYIDHNSLIVGRKFSFSEGFSIEPTVGYGLESVYRRPFANLNYENDNFQWIPKSEYGNYYLSGVFGGVQFTLFDALYLSAEYDSQYFNVGASVLLLKKIGLQVNLLDEEEFTGSLSYKVFLDKPRKFKPKF
jgi:hypothetical protein